MGEQPGADQCIANCENPALGCETVIELGTTSTTDVTSSRAASVTDNTNDVTSTRGVTGTTNDDSSVTPGRTGDGSKVIIAKVCIALSLFITVLRF